MAKSVSKSRPRPGALATCSSASASSSTVSSVASNYTLYAWFRAGRGGNPTPTATTEFGINGSSAQFDWRKNSNGVGVQSGSVSFEFNVDASTVSPNGIDFLLGGQSAEFPGFTYQFVTQVQLQVAVLKTPCAGCSLCLSNVEVDFYQANSLTPNELATGISMCVDKLLTSARGSKGRARPGRAHTMRSNSIFSSNSIVSLVPVCPDIVRVDIRGTVEMNAPVEIKQNDIIGKIYVTTS